MVTQTQTSRGYGNIGSLNNLFVLWRAAVTVVHRNGMHALTGSSKPTRTHKEAHVDSCKTET
jgi:hypothetical protein